MLNITLKQLELFTAVVECGSFTRAAEQEFVTQSTVSVHVAALESALGATLFTRENHRRVTLTPAGRTAYAYAREIVSHCREMERRVSQKEKGKLRIGASSVPAQWLVPTIMAGFIAQCSDCSFALRKGDSGGVHHLLRRRVVRIGFVGTMLSPEEMVYTPLLRDRLVLLTPNTPEYQALKAQGAEGDRLLDRPLILREKDSGSRMEFLRYLDAAGVSLDEGRVVAEIDQPAAILEAVAGGMGVSPMSALTARGALAEGRVLAFDLGGGLYRELYLVTRRDFTPTQIEEEFIAFVKQTVSAPLSL